MSTRLSLQRHGIRGAVWLSLLLVFAMSSFVSDRRVSAVSAAGTVPAGFADDLVTNVSLPTALAFAPGGRLLIATQPGVLRVYQNGTLLTTPALDIRSKTCQVRERGLVGVAVDPAFSTNHYIYLYYSFNKYGNCSAERVAATPVNRVSRFVLAGNSVVDPSSERVLIDNIPSKMAVHNAGDLHFGKDGHLYISVGDGGCAYDDFTKCGATNDASRDLNTLSGKILRITRNAAVPDSNPFLGPDSVRCALIGHTAPGKRCQETFW